MFNLYQRHHYNPPHSIFLTSPSTSMKRISFILFLLLSLCVRAYDIKVDDIHYNLNYEQHLATVCGCGGWVSGISIPESIVAYGQTFAVTAIADSAFMKNGFLQGVDIAPSVTYIGKCAFRDCNRLATIPIPASVTFIGEMAFRGCTAISEFVVDEKCPAYTSYEGVLYDKRMKTLLNCPISKWGEFHVPETVVTIAPYACYKCSKFGMVVIPNSVKTIGEHAFDQNTSLTDLHMGTSVEYIGDNAFDNNKNLKNVFIQSPVPPKAFDHTFDYNWVEYCKLHVMSSAVSAYKKAKPWSWFDSIVALTDREIEMSIDTPDEVLAAEKASYSLNGIKLRQKTAGIRIVQRANGSTRKILTK